MTNYDIFNGDADGICSLQQLRLAYPRDATLVTGVKRDIELVTTINANAGDVLTILDISLEKNIVAVSKHLDGGATVHYFDHHFAGTLPQHPAFHGHIDTAAHTCTALIVNAHLNGGHRPWAVVGAFGDGLDDSARAAAKPLGYTDNELDVLRQTGIAINYNAYGESLDDLFFPPAELFLSLHPFADPLVFARESPIPRILDEGYRNDLALAQRIQPFDTGPTHAVFQFPNEKWARRIGGVFANWLAQESPDRAHALLTRRSSGGYLVSVRAPLALRRDADTVCRQFPTGGGRKSAAGINYLPDADVDRFIAVFRTIYAPG